MPAIVFTVADGNAGLKFTRGRIYTVRGGWLQPRLFEQYRRWIGRWFRVGIIGVGPIADTPTVTDATTTVNTQTTSGLVITRNPADGSEVVLVKITNITNGKLFKNDGTTQIFNNEFIFVTEGNAGLKFTPANNSTASGSFQVQAAVGVTTGGSNVTATITVGTGRDHTDLGWPGSQQEPYVPGTRRKSTDHSTQCCGRHASVRTLLSS
jgi:hypothetical protein